MVNTDTLSIATVIVLPEGTDTCTRRRGAIDLVRALCRKYEDRLVPVLAQVCCWTVQVTNLIANFPLQLVQSLCADGDWIKLDVVYCLVTAIASKTETAKSGVTSTSQLVRAILKLSSRVYHLPYLFNINPY